VLITEQLDLIQSALGDWAAPYGGGCEIAGDIVHAFALLQHQPGSVRAVAWFTGEEKHGSFEEAGSVDRSFIVFISRGRGFALEPGDSLMRETAGGGLPLYDLVEAARQILRGLNFDEVTTAGTIDFRSIKPFAIATERPVDAYQIEFTIQVDLPDPGEIMAKRGLSVYSAPITLLGLAEGFLLAPTIEIYDDFAAYSAGLFTVPAAGLYLMECGFQALVPSGGWVEIQPTRSGAGIHVPAAEYFGTPTGGPNPITVYSHSVMKAALGDILSFRLYRAAGGDLVMSQPFIKIHRL